MKKCKKPDDVLFINASEHFENASEHFESASEHFENASEHFEKGKRQNRLLPEHIEKIVDTYQYRKEEERYARRVTMEEIEENDYNLNISRYVSISKPEPEIDLQAGHAKLVEIEKKVGKAAENHNKFLNELGLPPV